MRWSLAIIGFALASDAAAKDVAGLFLGAFILSGAVVGLVAGVLSPFLRALKFLRGGVLALGLSLMPWAALLALIGNLPMMLFVLLGTIPVYLIAYAVVWMVVPNSARSAP